MLKTLDDLYKMTVGQFRKHNIEYSDEPFDIQERFEGGHIPKWQRKKRKGDDKSEI